MTKQKAKAKEQVITVAVPEAGTPEEAKATLAKGIPGWDNLSKEQQTELAEIAVAQRKQRQPVQVTLTPKPNGGMTIGMAGKCQTAFKRDPRSASKRDPLFR